MNYEGVNISRVWLEQARLMFPNETKVALAMLALLDYALYDKDFSGQPKLVQAFILGVTKMISAQRSRYANMKQSRGGININKNINNNINTNIKTSKKDEQAKWKLINSIKDLNDETDKEVHHNPFAVHKDGEDDSKE